MSEILSWLTLLLLLVFMEVGLFGLAGFAPRANINEVTAYAAVGKDKHNQHQNEHGEMNYDIWTFLAASDGDLPALAIYNAPNFSAQKLDYKLNTETRRANPSRIEAESVRLDHTKRSRRRRRRRNATSLTMQNRADTC